MVLVLVLVLGYSPAEAPSGPWETALTACLICSLGLAAVLMISETTAPLTLPLTVASMLVARIVEGYDSLPLPSLVLATAIGAAVVTSYGDLRRTTIATTAIATGYLAVAHLFGSRSDVASAIDEVILGGAMAGAGAAFVRAMLAAAADADRLHESQRDVALRSSIDLTASRVALTVHRLLHDRIIATLAAIGDARVDDAGLRRAAAESLRSARETLTHKSSMALRDAVELSARSHSLSITLEFSDAAASVPLQPRTVAAITAAVGEAIRNTERHAGASRVSICGEHHHDTVQLTIADDGGGLLGVPSGWGTRNSIIRSIELVGGQAVITSTPHGAQIVLEVPALESTEKSRLRTRAQVHAATVAALRGDDHLALVITAALVVAHLYIAVRYATVAAAASPQIALAPCVAVLTLLLVQGLRRKPLGITEILTFVALGSAGIVWSLDAAGPQSTYGYHSWVVGLVSVGHTIIAFYTPARWALVGPLASVVAIVTTIFTAGSSVASSVGALNAAVTPPMIAFCIGASLRASNAQIDSELERLLKIGTDLQERYLEATMASTELAVVRAVVVPFLEQISEGTLDPSSGSTRTRARLLARDVRDDLVVPGALDVFLKLRIRMQRAQGTMITFGEGETRDPAHQVWVRVVDRILDHLRSDHHLLVQPGPALGPHRLVVAPPLEQHQVAAVTRGLDGVSHEVLTDVFCTTFVVDTSSDHRMEEPFAEGV